ncbi:MAG: hypothetical protein QW734_03715 [Candidatus Bathyarchaeia archaeon]
MRICECETGEEISIEEICKSKNKRKPSAYNLFMKDCIKQKSGTIQERFKECAKEYKLKKS